MVNKDGFKDVAADENHQNWNKLIQREHPLYDREGDVRTPFARDYTRILHSMAYRRLKHKTQVFFNIDNDHVCTRMEHVGHVESVSSTIARTLGLNEELTRAIAIGHDLGHAPFGHQGERILNCLSKKYLDKEFWHEKNGLRFVDHIELLEDDNQNKQNLYLTYAVRDGIIAHCGEIDQNGIVPRSISIPLQAFDKPGAVQAATWEGCVVKIADKIAYLGRDIEDAITLGFLNPDDLRRLRELGNKDDISVINTTVIIHKLITDICENSSPDKGIMLSDPVNERLNAIKDFNLEHIYKHERLQTFMKYSELVLSEIFFKLKSFYDGEKTWDIIQKNNQFAPKLTKRFSEWLACYCDSDIVPNCLKYIADSYINEKIYGELDTEETYIQAIIDYISGMTDRFAIELFTELIQY